MNCNDSTEMMFTTLFRSSMECYERMVSVVLVHNEVGEDKAVLIATNYIDTAVDNLTLRFQGVDETWSEFPLSDGLTDYSKDGEGMVLFILPADKLIKCIRESDMMKVTYRAGDGELIEMQQPILGANVLAGCSFEEQLKECPRLSKLGK